MTGFLASYKNILFLQIDKAFRLLMEKKAKEKHTSQTSTEVEERDIKVFEIGAV